ncbi:hypothetical protein BH11PLA2_BH11PLA2_03160 [soil metagenome]
MYIVRCLFAFCGLNLGVSEIAFAQVYLNGGLAYQANNSTGANVGGPFEFDSFVTSNSGLYFNSVTETPLLLAPGIQTFNMGYGSPSGSATVADGIGLYFTTNNTLLSSAGLPDLVAYQTGSGSAFAIPLAGTSVPSFGAFSGEGPYSGATSFVIGGQAISITGWDNSTVTLNVVPVPEPATLMIVTLSMIAVSRKHRRSCS